MLHHHFTHFDVLRHLSALTIIINNNNDFCLGHLLEVIEDS